MLNKGSVVIPWTRQAAFFSLEKNCVLDIFWGTLARVYHLQGDLDPMSKSEWCCKQQSGEAELKCSSPQGSAALALLMLKQFQFFLYCFCILYLLFSFHPSSNVHFLAVLHVYNNTECKIESYSSNVCLGGLILQMGESLFVRWIHF